MSNRRSRKRPTSVAVALVVAACGGSSSDNTSRPAQDDRTTTSSAAAATTTTAAPAPATTTMPSTTSTTTTLPPQPAEELPPSSVTAILGAEEGLYYKYDLTGAPLDFEESELPVAPGTVEVRWYTYEGVYVVAFAGVDPARTGPLCPGASGSDETGFVGTTNAPTEPGACEGFTTLTDDPNVGPRVCRGNLVYVTAINTSVTGGLFGTIEALRDDGASFVGLTSFGFPIDPPPAIDLDAYCA